MKFCTALEHVSSCNDFCSLLWKVSASIVPTPPKLSAQPRLHPTALYAWSKLQLHSDTEPCLDMLQTHDVSGNLSRTVARILLFWRRPPVPQRGLAGVMVQYEVPGSCRLPGFCMTKARSSVRVGLHRVCLLSKFVIFIDGISRHSQNLEVLQFWGDPQSSISAFCRWCGSLDLDLQILGWFESNWLSTAKSEAKVLQLKTVDCTLCLDSRSWAWARFKYFSVLLLIGGKMDWEIDMRISTASYGGCAKLSWWRACWAGRQSFPWTMKSMFKPSLLVMGFELCLKKKRSRTFLELEVELVPLYTETKQTKCLE